METQTTPRPRRWRFSLWTGLLVFTLLAVTISHIATSLRLAKIEKENLQFRRETGTLVVEPGTEDQLQAIAVPTVEPMTWQWRVHMPEGKRYSSGCMTSKIPALYLDLSNMPKDMENSHGWPPGDHLVTLALRRDHLDQWRWQYSIGVGGSGATGVPATATSWITSPLGHGGFQTNHKSGQVVVPHGEPLVLLCIRAFVQMTPTSYGEPDGPADGVLFWITQVGPTNSRVSSTAPKNAPLVPP